MIYFVNEQKVPEGDWFCDVCKPKERTPRKRRKLYTEEVEQEEANSRYFNLYVLYEKVKLYIFHVVHCK